MLAGRSTRVFFEQCNQPLFYPNWSEHLECIRHENCYRSFSLDPLTTSICFLHFSNASVLELMIVRSIFLLFPVSIIVFIIAIAEVQCEARFHSMACSTTVSLLHTNSLRATVKAQESFKTFRRETNDRISRYRQDIQTYPIFPTHIALVCCSSKKGALWFLKYMNYFVPWEVVTVTYK